MTGEKKPDEVKFCLQCQKQMTRKRFSGVLEDGGVFHRRKFCDRICMAKHQEKEIKTKHTLLKKALKFRGRVCEKCGTTQQLNIHHINLDESDNSPENLMTLCAPCHTTWHWEHGKQPATKRQNMYCKICGQPAKKLGMCQMHYQRFRKYGDPLLTKKKIGSSFVLQQETLGTQNGPTSPESQPESKIE